jgi:serine-type D-Ala-D-Ala carboxypeptidase (penicillin-binding protein 5/6)
MKYALFIPSLIGLLSLPVQAAAPTFESAAPAAIMIDLSSGAGLYMKNPDARILPASMTKMMTSHVVFDLVASGKLKLSQKFMVRPETWKKWHGPEAGSTMYLSAGEQVSVENLLLGLVTLSGNDACVVLAEGVAGTEQAFVALMNQKAKQLGMTRTHFGTSTGWPDRGATYSTVRDIAKLGASTIRHYPGFYKKFYGRPSFAWGQSGGGGTISQPNRNPILGKIEGADGIKTGHTAEAGFNFAGSAVQKGRRLLMVVAGLPSYESRISDSVKLMDWGFKAWSSKAVFPANKIVGSARVQMGDTATVGLVSPQDLGLTFPVGPLPAFQASIAYKGPLKPPILRGQNIARLVIRSAGLPDQITPLYAANDVMEAGFFRRAWLGFLTLVGL